MKPNDLDNYISSINELKETTEAINIFAGLEIDYIPDTITPADFQSKLDYTIGSIHFVERFDDGTPWEIDGTLQFFLEGFEQIFKKNIKDTISRYYELTREMVVRGTPDIVGHLDKIKIQNTDNRLFQEEDPWYKEQLYKTIDTIAEAGCIVEVNTRGIYQKKSVSTYPGPLALRYILERKVPILISSDAHHKDDLTNHFEETASLLYSLGFREHAILQDGDWIMIPFNSYGLELRK